MPDTPVRVVTACLWDLRAQCEQQLRCLGEAQRLVDASRHHPVDGPLLRARIHAHLDEVLRAATGVAAGVQDCMAHVERLPDTTQR